MEKETITIAIGENKALVFEADPSNKADMELAKLCRKVNETQPKSLQEFFTRLQQLQQQPVPESKRKRSKRL